MTIRTSATTIRVEGNGEIVAVQGCTGVLTTGAIRSEVVLNCIAFATEKALDSLRFQESPVNEELIRKPPQRPLS